MLEFISGPAPKGFKPDFESFLFNTAAHRLTQSKAGWKEFHLLDKKRKKVMASVAFHLQNSEASSPCRSPFGSYEVSEKLGQTDLMEFIQDVEKHLNASSVSQIKIVHPPALYGGLHSRVVAALLRAGYSPIHCDVSCCIPVDEIPLSDKMDKRKRNRFQFGMKAGFVFKKLPPAKLNDVYLFIESCRTERNQSLSLSLAELNKIARALPKSFHFFSVYHEGQMIAASICIRVSKGILYTFYSAHQKQHDRLTPLTFLLGHLYEWCYHHSVTLLDMGTSTVDDSISFNLLDYKMRVGGSLSPKFTFRKQIKR